jgi:hypothetical protein
MNYGLMTDLDFLATLFTLLYLAKLLFFSNASEDLPDSSCIETVKRSLHNQQIRRRMA